MVKNRYSGPNGYRADEAVDQSAYRFPFAATEAVKGGRLVVICRYGRNKGRTGKKPLQIPQVPFVPCPGKDFHANRIADRYLAAKQGLDSVTGYGPGVPEEFHPR